MCLQLQSLWWMKNFCVPVTANDRRRIYPGCCISELSKPGINFFFCNEKKAPFYKISIIYNVLKAAKQQQRAGHQPRQVWKFPSQKQVPLDGRGHDLWPSWKKIHWEASRKLSTCMLEELKLPLSPPFSPSLPFHCTSYVFNFKGPPGSGLWHRD